MNRRSLLQSLFALPLLSRTAEAAPKVPEPPAVKQPGKVTHTYENVSRLRRELEAFALICKTEVLSADRPIDHVIGFVVLPEDLNTGTEHYFEITVKDFVRSSRFCLTDLRPWLVSGGRAAYAKSITARCRG